MVLANTLDNGAIWYTVPEGVCGFAWIRVYGNTGFVKWAKKEKGATADYPSGTCLYWVTEYNQSIQRKEAFAKAAAQVLKKYGIRATAQSRLD
jgi:hypothetical protein